MPEFPVLSQICANLKAMQKVIEKEGKTKGNVCQVIIEAPKKYRGFLLYKKGLKSEIKVTERGCANSA